MSPPDLPNLQRALAAEACGTALLVAAVIGSGIMAERLAGGNAAIALLANTIATGAALVALISAFAVVSGAHFNPVVSCAEAALGRMAWKRVAPYIVVQIVAAMAGTLIAHAMFEVPLVSWSHHERHGAAILFSEVVATFGLLTVVFHAARANSSAVPSVAAGWIMAAYWFTASTSFANPAVTIARAMSDSFAGIRSVDVLPFIIAQIVGGALAVAFFRWVARPTIDASDS